MVSRLLIMFLLLGFLTGCGVKFVDDGNVAIVVDSYSKNIHQKVAESGTHIKPFTDFYQVSSTDIRIELKDLQPKDKKGMKFEDVDLSVTVRLKKDKAVQLYTETREINEVVHLNRYVLGYRKMEQIVKSSAAKAFQALDYQEFMDNRKVIENQIEEEIKLGIAELMYDSYEVKDVNTTTINLMPEIEMSFQNRSLVAQKELLVKSKESLMLKEMELKEKEMLRYADIARKAGVSVKDIMEFEVQRDRNEVLSDLSKGDKGSNLLLNVDK